MISHHLSQKRGAATGPNISHSQQIHNMIKERDLELDPISRILKDLRDFVASNRSQGFCPFLMIDRDFVNFQRRKYPRIELNSWLMVSQSMVQTKILLPNSKLWTQRSWNLF